MKLVEYYQRYAFQAGVPLETTGKNPLGHHLDPGPRRDTPFEAHGIAHRLAGLLAKGERHAVRGIDRGKSPGLEHHDTSSAHRGKIEQCQRDTGRFAGPRRCLQDGIRGNGNRLQQLRKNGIYGKGSSFHGKCTFRGCCFAD